MYWGRQCLPISLDHLAPDDYVYETETILLKPLHFQASLLQHLSLYSTWRSGGETVRAHRWLQTTRAQEAVPSCTPKVWWLHFACLPFWCMFLCRFLLFLDQECPFFFPSEKKRIKFIFQSYQYISKPHWSVVLEYFFSDFDPQEWGKILNYQCSCMRLIIEL